MTHVLVTGGAGFIGSNLVRYLLEHRPAWNLTVFDALTYAGTLDNLSDLLDSPRLRFIHGDVTDRPAVDAAIKDCMGLFHLAAQTHVDRSIEDASPFVRTNLVGTQCIIDAARDHGLQRLVVASTDEVYGSLPLEGDGRFTEESPLQPSSPYAASKAGADMLALAACHTDDVPVLITRCSNNLGPFQHPEKVIPRFITNLLRGRRIPIYGDGRNVRDWIHVEDHCSALLAVFEKGEVGRVYNIGAGCERSNNELARLLLEATGRDESFINYVSDRPGHDLRYAIDASRIREELGWCPVRSTWPNALLSTVAWYASNQTWWDRPADSTRRAA